MVLGVLTALIRGARRAPLTSKIGPIGYYKGNGANQTGFQTRKGGFKVVPGRVTRFVVPDLTDFALKPFVSRKSVRTSTPPATAAAFLALHETPKQA